MAKVQFKNIGVDLPEHVARVLKLCGADDPKSGGTPAALGRLIGIMAHVAGTMHAQLPPAEYRAFAEGTTSGLEQLRQLINSANPSQALAALSAQELRNRKDA